MAVAKLMLGIFEVDCVYTLCDIQCINTVINYFYNSSMQFIDFIITWNVHVYITARYLASIVCNLCRGEGSADQWTNRPFSSTEYTGSNHYCLVFRRFWAQISGTDVFHRHTSHSLTIPINTEDGYAMLAYQAWKQLAPS